MFERLSVEPAPRTSRSAVYRASGASGQLWRAWLDPALDGEAVREFLVPVPSEQVVVRPANPLVNSARNEGPAALPYPSPRRPPKNRPGGQPGSWQLTIDNSPEPLGTVSIIVLVDGCPSSTVFRPGYPAAMQPKGRERHRAATSRDPWEAEPAWHPARRAAFQCYRDMGPGRSVRKVAKALDTSVALVGRWSGEDSWPERAAAWDAELDLRRREEFTASAMDASREQAETAARIRLGVDAFARSFLDELAGYRERGEDPFADLTPSQKLAKLGAAARALQHSQQVERLARGLSTENVGGHARTWPIPPEIERKSAEELESYLLGRREAWLDEAR